MKNRLLPLLAIAALLSCQKPADVNPLLIGNWLMVASTSYGGGDWVSTSPDYGQVISFNRDGSISGLTGCGCLTAQTYRQKEDVLLLTWGGIPCPTFVACPPEPDLDIISLTADELLLRQGQFQARYKRL